MPEPFRGPAFGRSCPGPACGGSLREFQHRLVCNECGGMLIGVADLTSAIADLTADARGIQLHDEEKTQQACPRCHGQLVQCKLAIVGYFELEDVFKRCERDGVWFDGGVMVAMFERIGRRSHAGAGAGRTYGGVGGGDHRVKVGQRRKPKPRPRVHMPFASAYRDDPLRCPVCPKTRLRLEHDRWSCDVCNGMFVETAALEAMVMEMTRQPWEVPAGSGAPTERPCPVCSAPLAGEDLEGVAVDRCTSHGVWFDADELAQALAHASGVAEGGGWLRRLFFT